ncbi:hypothetical protein SAMN04488103_101742 [Gemmobacter aquatilis]|uniref:Uncharacterized protein n=1 Tax=Gemmobacter aquatilis TaxID=933059 RepID=A0A1H8A4U2_9RHOB|nr:hypothetical protein [Gemmobacter aquatilis]SEM64848.1 hypothetical protein SAMN04488103_101742 [Gemmobacter aquatilis]
MDRKRQIALVAALVAVGLGAGHFVQKDAPQQTASLPAVKPTTVVPLAAGPDDLPEPAPPVVKAPPATVPLASPAAVEAEACAAQLDMIPRARAMIGITLIAPCHGHQRVVIKHGGLVVTGRASANGVLFLDLPAMEPSGRVTVTFADGETVQGALPVPDMAAVQRFAVQWLDEDAFQINAFEDGADYGDPGHVSQATPHHPSDAGGFLTLLGDATVDLPMLAEVYTYPAAGKAEVVVEAAVTQATCGRELLGETLASQGGEVRTEELTLAMPECEAEGDILVLKNLAPERKLATR